MEASLRSVMLLLIGGGEIDLSSHSVVSGDASASKPEEVKRLPGGKLKKKVGPLSFTPMNPPHCS